MNPNHSKRKLSVIAALIVLSIITVATISIVRARSNQSSNTNPKTDNASNNAQPDRPLLFTNTGFVVDGVRKFEWVLQDNKIVEGTSNIQVRKGEEVEIKITSKDKSGETYVNLEDHLVTTEVLHSNGFGLLSFKAEKSGTFKILAQVENEEHEAGAEAAQAPTALESYTLGNVEVKGN